MKKLILVLSIMLLSLSSLTGCTPKEEKYFKKCQKELKESYIKDFGLNLDLVTTDEYYEIVSSNLDKLSKFEQYSSLLSLKCVYDKYYSKSEDFHVRCKDDIYSLELDREEDMYYVTKNGKRLFSKKDANKEMAEKINASKTVLLSDNDMKSEAETAVKRELNYGAYNFRKMKVSGNDVTGICEYEKKDKGFTVHFFEDGGYELKFN